MQPHHGPPPPHGPPPAGGYGPSHPHHAYPPHPHHPHPGGAPPPGYGPGLGYAYGPPPGYGHVPYDPRVAELDNQSTTWLIVGAVSFVLGVWIVSGPVTWIFAGKIRNRYRKLGLQPNGNATAAWIIGIVSTAFGALALLLGAFMMLLMFGSIAAGL